MTRTPVRALAVLCGILAGAAPGAAQAPLGCLEGFERRVVELVNAERQAVGLPPLEPDVRLLEAAELHSLDMAENDFASHTGSGGTSPVDRVVAAGYAPWWAVGENVAAGQPTPESVVAAWMASPGHRANILSEAFTDLGVGHAFGPGTRYGHYWTQTFGASPGALEPPDLLCPACSNGVEDDGDGLVDHPDDPGCRDAASPREDPACDDGVDNDGDGAIDWDGSPPDPLCLDPWRPRENAPGRCGLGFELAPLLALVSALRRRAKAGPA